jgi:hypothetical protein
MGGTGEHQGSLQGTSHEKKKLLMQSWIDLNSKGDDAFTALHFASFHGNTRMIKLLE